MEGLVAPSKLYSSLAVGRPIAAICERNSYLRGVIQSARCGEAFDNGDGTSLAGYIRRLSQDSQLLAETGRRARRYFEANFTLDVIAQNYFNVVMRKA
jgi:glycosyltransferase involved in cell wall biosynthesis